MAVGSPHCRHAFKSRSLERLGEGRGGRIRRWYYGLSAGVYGWGVGGAIWVQSDVSDV